MKLYIIGYVVKINIKSFLKIKEENKIVKFIEEILLFHNLLKIVKMIMLLTFSSISPFLFIIAF